MYDYNHTLCNDYVYMCVKLNSLFDREMNVYYLTQAPKASY